MLRFEVHLEDIHFVAESSKEGWIVRLWESFEGKSINKCWTTSELSAVLALACGLGEESDSNKEMVAELYKLAEKAVEGLEIGLRPIP